MNRTAKALARKVANGTVTLKSDPTSFRAFKEAVALLGWEGKRGQGVVNHVDHSRVSSWATLAQILLQEAEETAANGAESAAITLAHSGAFQAVQLVAESVPTEEPAAPQAEAGPEVSYFYSTQVPAVAISDSTTVEALITEGIMGVTEGLCESGASLECSLEDPSMGLLRTLPESMLPGQERTIIIQCLPCYEASAEAYVRKLHRAEA